MNKGTKYWTAQVSLYFSETIDLYYNKVFTDLRLSPLFFSGCYYEDSEATSY